MNVTWNSCELWMLTLICWTMNGKFPIQLSKSSSSFPSLKMELFAHKLTNCDGAKLANTSPVMSQSSSLMCFRWAGFRVSMSSSWSRWHYDMSSTSRLVMSGIQERVEILLPAMFKLCSWCIFIRLNKFNSVIAIDSLQNLFRFITLIYCLCSWMTLYL